MTTQSILQPPRGDRPHLDSTILGRRCQPRGRRVSGFRYKYIKSAARAEDSDRRGLSTNMCTGSQDKDVIHFVCPLSASPIGFPVLGSHIRTFEDEMAAYIRKSIWRAKNSHGCRVPPSPVFVQEPPTRRTEPNLCARRACAKAFP